MSMGSVAFFEKLLLLIILLVENVSTCWWQVLGYSVVCWGMLLFFVGAEFGKSPVRVVWLWCGAGSGSTTGRVEGRDTPL